MSSTYLHRQKIVQEGEIAKLLWGYLPRGTILDEQTIRSFDGAVPRGVSGAGGWVLSRMARLARIVPSRVVPDFTSTSTSHSTRSRDSQPAKNL
jgi:hypothetical protein